MNIKELLKRNSPVFFIGLVTLGIFIIIITTSQFRQPVEPELVRTGEDALITQYTNTIGPDDSPLLITIFTNFACPTCSEYHNALMELRNKYPEYISIAFRHYPLKKHERSDEAARAAQAAGSQNKFWEYANLLFNNQDKLSEGDFMRYADILDLDLNKFRSDYNKADIIAQVEEDKTYMQGLNYRDVPVIFINGDLVYAANPTQLKEAVEARLLRAGLDIDNATGPQIEPEPEQQIKKESDNYLEIYNEVDVRFGTETIEFNGDNFEPRNAAATAGQKIIFVNNSDREIVIKQLMDTYEAFTKDVSLEPGESFEFRLELRKYGLWTYKNDDNPVRASILVSKLPKDLRETLEELDELQN